MKKCNITFNNDKTRKILEREFSNVDKHKNCIRKECNFFGKQLPNDITVIETEEVSIDNISDASSFEITKDMIPEKGKFNKFLKFNSDGSCNFFILLNNGEKLSPNSKKFQNEAKRVENLLSNAECKHCYIVNNFELFGEEICKRNNLSYLFFTYGKMMDTIVITIMSSKGNLGRINGEEIKTGCFKDLENISFDKIQELLDDDDDFDINIFINYENPKISFKR